MLQVYLTIDTECSLGGAWRNPQFAPVPPNRAILGKIGARYYGTPLIMDILEQNGLRGTFFLEVLARDVVPRSQMEEAYREIVERGHDSQLHLHPVYHFYKQFQRGLIRRDQLPANMDLIGSLPLETQVQLLQEGTGIFRELVGRTPLAFRAGCFGGSLSNLEALAKLGFQYDSSFNAAYQGISCMIDALPSNVPWQHGPVWEIPVTNFETGVWKLRRLKPLDIAAVSFLEMRRVLQQAQQLGMSVVVFVMHSFTLFKKADPQFLQLRPDRLVIRRFRRLCRFLRDNAQHFKVATFSAQPQFSTPAKQIGFPAVGAAVPVGRKIVQGLNRNPWI